MTEEFLYYLWKYKQYNSDQLETHTGEAIQLIKPGERNTDSGPDFFNARIKIGETLWAGNVEIHVKSSDWKKHNHQTDKAYDNVILHVVHENDECISHSNGEVIPTLELKDKFDQGIYQKYIQFKESNSWIPCSSQIKSIDSLIRNSWLSRLLIERLERKSEAIVLKLQINNHNWEETFYQHIARSFGFHINSDPFEQLARSLPNSILAKHKNSLFQIEALLFGQSGMLEDEFKDMYLQYLQSECNFLQKKYNLVPLDAHIWKYLRLRPSNFPTIRISQFASLIHKSIHLFSKILETETAEDLKKMFDVSVSEYWETHYVLDKESAHIPKRLGEDAINGIIINTVVPFLFVYGKYMNEEKFVSRALHLLEEINSEHNSIIQQWEQIGISSENAAQSQALLQLKNEYCSKKRCLDCSIGSKLLQQT